MLENLQEKFSSNRNSLHLRVWVHLLVLGCIVSQEIQGIAIQPVVINESNASCALLDIDARSGTYQKREGDKQRKKCGLVQLLRGSGHLTLAQNVEACNREYFTIACRNGHVVSRIPTFRCRNRLCPYCAVERQRREVTKLLPKILSLAKEYTDNCVVLITFTVGNNFDPLSVQDKTFKADLRKLRRTKRWKANVIGAVCGYEFTLTATGWHYHAHLIAVCQHPYAQTELVEDWMNATRGKGSIVDMRPVSDSTGGLRKALWYCFKPTKFENWTSREVQQFQSMRKVKLAECFGQLRGMKVDNESEESAVEQLCVGSPCPQCGEPLQRKKISWHNFESGEWDSKAWFVSARDGP